MFTRRTRVSVGGGQHQVLLIVDSRVECLQLLQHKHLDQLTHHGAVNGDKHHPALVIILDDEGSGILSGVDS